MPPLAAVTCLLLCVSVAQESKTKPDPFPRDHWNQLLESGTVETRRRELDRLLGFRNNRELAPIRDPLLRAMAHDADPTVRVLAATVVARNNGVVHADAELNAAVPSLAKLLDDKDPYLRRLAGHALASIGGDGLAALLPALTGDDKARAWEVIQMFRDAEEKTCPAALTHLASGDNRRAALLASCAAGEMKSGSLAQLPAADRNVKWCIEALRDPRDKEGLALGALNAYGPKAAPAIGAIIDWYLRQMEEAKGKGDDKEEQAAMPGLYIAGLVCSMRQAAFGPLVELMEKGDTNTRGMAAILLGNFTTARIPLPDAALPPLIRMLDDPELQGTAANVIDGYGPRARAAAPALIRMIAGDDPDCRKVAAEALHKIDANALQNSPEAAALVPALMKQLEGNDAGEASAILCLLGPKAIPAVRPILRASVRYEKEGHHPFHYDLKKLGPAAIPELVKAFQDKDPKVRAVACHALGNLDAAAQGALTALEELAAQEQDRDARIAARVAIDQVTRAVARRRPVAAPPATLPPPPGTPGGGREGAGGRVRSPLPSAGEG